MCEHFKKCKRLLKIIRITCSRAYPIFLSKFHLPKGGQGQLNLLFTYKYLIDLLGQIK